MANGAFSLVEAVGMAHVSPGTGSVLGIADPQNPGRLSLGGVSKYKLIIN